MFVYRCLSELGLVRSVTVSCRKIYLTILVADSDSDVFVLVPLCGYSTSAVYPRIVLTLIHIRLHFVNTVC